MTDRPDDTGVLTISKVAPREGDPLITPELVEDHGHGLRRSMTVYSRIRKLMGGTPTFTELGVFSAMWSEHCGYKNSKRLLSGCCQRRRLG